MDDELTNLRVLKSVFYGEEYEVLTAANGIDAVEIIKKAGQLDEIYGFCYLE